MSTTFKEKTITRNEVLGALARFDRQHPDSNTYEGWLDKQSYKYALKDGVKLYPPKHILSKVAGIDTSEFNGGEQTNRVFRQLGFEIVPKPETHKSG